MSGSNSKFEFNAEHFSSENQIPLPASPLDATVLLGESARVDRRAVPELAIDGHQLFHAAQIYRVGKLTKLRLRVRSIA